MKSQTCLIRSKSRSATSILLMLLIALACPPLEAHAADRFESFTTGPPPGMGVILITAEPDLGIITLMGNLAEMARIDSGTKNELPELRFLYDLAVKSSKLMESLTEGAKLAPSSSLAVGVNQTIAFDQDVASVKRLLEAAADRGLTDEEVSSICTVLSGWKDAYTVNLLLHSFPFWNRTPILPAEDLLSLISEPHRRKVTESELLRLLLTASDDYRLEDFKYEGKTSFAALWQTSDYDLQVLFAKGFAYRDLVPSSEDVLPSPWMFLYSLNGPEVRKLGFAYVMIRQSLRARDRARDLDVQALPNTESTFLQLLVRLKLANEHRELFECYNDNNKLSSCLRRGTEAVATVEKFADLDVAASHERFSELSQALLAERHYWLATYLGQYGLYRVVGPPAGRIQGRHEPSKLTDDAEIDYINRLEKALRRLAAIRQRANQSLTAVRAVADELRGEKRISDAQYHRIIRYVDASRDMSHTLDKLNRIFIIDKPLQLWGSLAHQRIAQSLGTIWNDHPAIMAAGVSLSRVSFLLSHTVESATGSAIVAATASIKEKLSESEFKQTQLESKLQPDWFQQIGLEMMRDGVN